MGDQKNIPKHGLKRKLNHVYPENRSQNYTPTIRVIFSILPLILRYIWYYIKAKLFGNAIVMDYVKVQRAKQIYGVPIGGIGCGSIGRGFRGEFCRFQMQPGQYEWNTVEANQFIITIKDEHTETIFHSLLSTFDKKSLKSWKSLLDPTRCFYTGLYPRSWTEYDLSDYGIKLICRQISPVIPHDYKNSSLPCAVFEWDVENVCDAQRTVTIAFMFKNGTGNSKIDRASACSSKKFNYLESEGVVLHHTINKSQCSYTLAAKKSDDVNVSECMYFDPKSDGFDVWEQLRNSGRFDKAEDTGQMHGEMGCGIACQKTFKAFERKAIAMTLVWDMPLIYFTKRQKGHYRFYTEEFGRENAALKIVNYALREYGNWERAIYEWQKPVLDDSQLPDWYKSALFNETYYVSDSGSIWLALQEEDKKDLPEWDPRRKYGRYLYLEGHEYRMYNSYDVHFYASHALNKNWPRLQATLQYDLRDCVFVEVPNKVEMLYDGHTVERKVVDTVPHDLGDPDEEPIILPNAYPIHDVSEWRDLNSKFVLQVFRDAQTENGMDERFVKDMYNACYIVLHKSEQHDVDGDGVIENSGKPDQTYDTWVMQGTSAYCGGLWLAAVYCMTRMADMVGNTHDKEKFSGILEKGREAFERKLWNGRYYNFDCSEKEKKSIMSDQLCAQWYLRCCGVSSYPIIPKENVITTLKTIYENNVESFCGGKMGAVNGFIEGAVDLFTVQSMEIWTGVTYALAATMIQEDLVEEGFKTAAGMYRSMTDMFGLAFSTPEALYEHKYYRAIGYMRPLSIWSMQIAWEERKRNTLM